MKPLTAKRILDALRGDPELLLKIRGLLMNEKVAGPWTDFNSSPYSKKERVSYGNDSVSRFTPTQKAEGKPIASVTPTIQFTRSVDSERAEEIGWDAAKAEREAEKRMKAENPWHWLLEWELRCHMPDTETTGGHCKTKQEALDEADKVLRELGWLLVQ